MANYQPMHLFTGSRNSTSKS